MRGFAVVAAMALLTAPALAQEAPKQRPQCFSVESFENWRAQDTKTIYIRADLNRYFRVEFVQECQALAWPDARLIMNVRGSHLICSPVDLDLRVSEGVHDIAMPCIVKSLTALSPADVAALPKTFKP